MKKKKNIYYLMSFFIPIILFLLIFFLKVGDINGEYILISDMEAQYNSLFQYLKNVFNGTESLFYSFNKGLGGEMFTTFTYYLSSPLNLLLLFFKDSQIPNCILLIILLKIGLSGLTMNIYLNSQNDNNNKINLLFATCYALMGYTINYYFNIMWLDAIYMLPLVILGLEKLINEKKVLFYIITLSYTIFCNYYMGYMVCLFSLIYFIYYILVHKKYDKKGIVLFIISSILAAGINAIILLPTIIRIPYFASTQGDLNITFNYIHNIFEGILKNILIAGHNCSEVSNQYGTYLYITVFCTVLVILYLLNKDIDKREKMGIIIIIILFILSFFLLPLTYIWHGFSIPSFLNNRHSFLLCFFLIVVAYKSFNFIKSIDTKQIAIIISIFIIISVLQFIFIDVNIIKNILMTLLWVIVYLYLLYGSKKYKIKYYKYLIIIFVGIELFINLYMSFLSKTIVVYSYDDYVNNICPIVSSNEISYRTENATGKNAIDGLTCGYKSSTMFLSTITNNDLDFFDQYGYLSGGKTVYNSLGNTIFMDSIMGIKYYYSDSNKIYLKKLDNTCLDVGEYNDYLKVIEQKEYCLYKNDNALSLGYVVKNTNVLTNDNVFENQNNLSRAIIGNKKDILYKLKYSNNNNIYKIENNKEKFYIYLESKNVTRTNEIKIYVNDEEKYADEDAVNITNNILEIVSNKDVTSLKIAGEDVNLIDDIKIYQANEELIAEELEKLKKQILTVEFIDKDFLKGNIDLKEDSKVLLTIPYDSNLKVLVDGKIISYDKAFDYLISVDLDRGKHEITIEYDKKIYYISSIISLFFIIIAIIFVKKCKKTNKNIKKI